MGRPPWAPARCAWPRSPIDRAAICSGIGAAEVRDHPTCPASARTGAAGGLSGSFAVRSPQLTVRPRRERQHDQRAAGEQQLGPDQQADGPQPESRPLCPDQHVQNQLDHSARQQPAPAAVVTHAKRHDDLEDALDEHTQDDHEDAEREQPFPGCSRGPSCHGPPGWAASYMHYTDVLLSSAGNTNSRHETCRA